MKLTTISYILGILIILNSCATSGRPVHLVQDTEITHRYKNLKFAPEELKKEMQNGVNITIQPIDAADLNKITFASASRDGNYEKELFGSESIPKGNSSLSRLEKLAIKCKSNGISEVTKLETIGNLSSNTAFQLKRRIWNGVKYGYSGTEVQTLSGISSYPDLFNQYKFNGKYLSVFKATFENQSSSITKINLSDFQIQSGEELLYPLDNNYFEENLINEPEKNKNALRMNMPGEITLTPGQKVIKYLSTPAINPSNENLLVQFIQEEKVESFNFSVKEISLSKKYFLNEYNIQNSGLGNSGVYYNFYAVEFEDGSSFALAKPIFYVSEEKKKQKLNIYAISIHKNSTNAYSSVLKNIELDKIKKSKISIEFGK